MELIRKSDALHAVLHNTGDAAVAAVQMIPSAWISVKDRLPDGKRESGEGEYVLATDGVVTTRAFYGYPGGHDEWFINAGEQWEATFDRPVTHWLPLPDAPEVEG